MVKYEQEYEKGKLYIRKTNWGNYKRGTIVTFILIKHFTQTTDFSYDTLWHVCVNYRIQIGITITFTDKRELDKDGICF
jgi:DNA gyrase subunit B